MTSEPEERDWEPLDYLGIIPPEVFVHILKFAAPFLFVIRECSKQTKTVVQTHFPREYSKVRFTLVMKHLKDDDPSETPKFMDWLDTWSQIGSTQINYLASKYGKVSILKWYCSRNSYVLQEVWYCNKAASRNDEKMLRWLRSDEAGKCCWDETTCAIVAKKGHLKLLQLLRSGNLGNICPWDIDTCKSAIEGGRLNVLKWCRDKKVHGKAEICPWGEICCVLAIEAKELAILKWLRNKKVHGKTGVCPWDYEECLAIAEDLEIRRWIVQNR